MEAYGHLTTPADDPLSERLAALWEDLTRLLADLRPDVVVVERVLFQVNARTAMSVGQASGLALAAAARAGCPVAQYSPNEVKLAVAGYGAATKEQVQRMVQVLLGLDEPPRPADRADALALAICHLSGAGLAAAAAAAQPGQGGRHDRLAAGGRPRPGRAAAVRPPRSCSKWAASATGCWCPRAPWARSAAPGSPAFLHVHTHVREDAIVLYGFPSRDERACFEALIGAHGVGPAVALALLSVTRRRRCSGPCSADDADALMLVPGHRQEDRRPAARRAQSPAGHRPRRGRSPSRRTARRARRRAKPGPA